MYRRRRGDLRRIPARDMHSAPSTVYFGQCARVSPEGSRDAAVGLLPTAVPFCAPMLQSRAGRGIAPRHSRRAVLLPASLKCATVAHVLIFLKLLGLSLPHGEARCLTEHAKECRIHLL